MTNEFFLSAIVSFLPPADRIFNEPHPGRLAPAQVLAVILPGYLAFRDVQPPSPSPVAGPSLRPAIPVPRPLSCDTEICATIKRRWRQAPLLRQGLGRKSRL